MVTLRTSGGCRARVPARLALCYPRLSTNALILTSCSFGLLSHTHTHTHTQMPTHKHSPASDKINRRWGGGEGASDVSHRGRGHRYASPLVVSKPEVMGQHGHFTNTWFVGWSNSFFVCLIVCADCKDCRISVC